MSKHTGRTLAGSSGALRSALDFYNTPTHDVEKFLLTGGLVPDGGIVLEPAAGSGNITTVLKQYRQNAVVVSGDIEQRDFPLEYVGDFLIQPFNREVDCIITNPPFSHAKEFVERGLDVCSGDVIMLLKLAFLATADRRALMDRKHLREMWVSSSRINCYAPDVQVSSTGRRTNSATLDMAWFVFNRNYKGDPVIKWL